MQAVLRSPAVRGRLLLDSGSWYHRDGSFRVLRREGALLSSALILFSPSAVFEGLLVFVRREGGSAFVQNHSSQGVHREKYCAFFVDFFFLMFTFFFLFFYFVLTVR